MKYYSEVTKELYDSPEALKLAESGVSTVKKSVKKTSKTETPSVPTRKELAERVEAAEKKVGEAQANLELAKSKAQEVSKKYLEEIDSILEPAKKELKDAQKLRYEAIQNFNEHYGAYQTTYTGTRAAEEFARAVADMQSFFPRLFRF